MAQYGYYFDSDKCTGCKSCQVACKETFGLPVDTLWRKVYNYQGGSWKLDEATGVYEPDGVFGYFVSMACNHCEMPACYAVCPVAAISKDEDTGIVTIDEELCIGCVSCRTACPYDAPSLWEEKGIFTKCDMCAALVEDGDMPICVAGCNMRALDFGELVDLQGKYGKGDVETEPLPLDSTTPSLVLNPHRDAQKTGTGTGSVVSFPEEL
ncbi:MAG: 4Fe-4S dicluster domain-containing protein [Coriobacteriaceae bacterium]|jgi:anaerobic dimethyl sulfoxide reductase subunit B (iron-sulfur subunit)|nr:4Fe-4S dicluster domain-containing protein [Coriobacteriaceae bacterium]